MSLDRKSVHVRLSPDMHRKLSVIAELADKDLAELASTLIEKAIAGEWHQFQLGLEKMKSLGINGE